MTADSKAGSLRATFFSSITTVSASRLAFFDASLLPDPAPSCSPARARMRQHVHRTCQVTTAVALTVCNNAMGQALSPPSRLYEFSLWHCGVVSPRKTSPSPLSPVFPLAARHKIPQRPTKELHLSRNLQKLERKKRERLPLQNSQVPRSDSRAKSRVTRSGCCHDRASTLRK